MRPFNVTTCYIQVSLDHLKPTVPKNSFEGEYVASISKKEDCECVSESVWVGFVDACLVAYLVEQHPD